MILCNLWQKGSMLPKNSSFVNRPRETVRHRLLLSCWLIFKLPTLQNVQTRYHEFLDRHEKASW